DDFVSIGDGTKNLQVQNVECGPGHGISMGSLGRYQNEAPRVGVYMKNCTFTNMQNGVRIKLRLGSYIPPASKLHFEGITVNNMMNPVVLDQAYCPYNHCTTKEASK
ncbi:hypothetical protein Ancab_029733, partial [Ancistrocladus abbreviatus]